MLHLLHGNLGQPADWDSVLARMPGAPECTRWPLWATRRQWAEASTLSGWARRFNAEVARLPGPHWLGGYSLGGRLALHALLDAPALWQGAVILSAHPGLADPDERLARRTADAAWQDQCLALPWAEFLTAWDGQPVLAGPRPAAAPHPAGLEPWRAEIATGFLDWSTGCQADLRPALATLRVPVRWLTGARDEKFAALAATAAPENPHFFQESVPGAGHRLLLDAPDAVAAAIGQLPEISIR